MDPIEDEAVKELISNIEVWSHVCGVINDLILNIIADITKYNILKIEKWIRTYCDYLHDWIKADLLNNSKGNKQWDKSFIDMNTYNNYKTIAYRFLEYARQAFGIIPHLEIKMLNYN